MWDAFKKLPVRHWRCPAANTRGRPQAGRRRSVDYRKAAAARPSSGSQRWHLRVAAETRAVATAAGRNPARRGL